MKQIILILAGILTGFSTFSQTQSSAYTAVGKGVATTFLTDYQCLGINPSALGFGTGYEDKKVTLGTSEMAFGVYSTALTKQNIKNLSATIRQQIFRENKENQGIDWNAQKEAAAKFSEQGIAINASYNWFGASFHGEKFGGIAFQVREKYNWYSKLNQETTDIVFRGRLSSYFDSLQVVFGSDTSTIANNPNYSNDTLAAAISGSIAVPLSLSKLTNGSKIKMRWDREYHIGYGRKLFGKEETLAVYAGVGLRYISSMAYFNFDSDGNNINLTTSLSPTFDIGYGVVANSNPSAVKKEVRKLPKSVGNGYGIDLSASVKLAKVFTFSAAVNNIGSVTYERNVYKVKDTLIGNLSLAGLDDASITNSINQLVSGDGILKLEGVKEVKVANSADIRIGGSFKPIDQINIGFDMVAPFNSANPGNITNPIFAFGGDFRPLKWLQLSAGYFGGGIYKNNIPVGINFILKEGSYEFGISSSDALTFFTEDSHSISTAFGFARIRF